MTYGLEVRGVDDNQVDPPRSSYTLTEAGKPLL